MKRFACAYILLALLLPAAAESVSGPYQTTLAVSSEATAETEIALEEIFGLAIEGDPAFIKGFDIELRIPNGLAQYRDSFALYAYQGITPAPSQGVRRYSGEELGFSVLPPARRQYVRYLFSGEKEGAADPDIQYFKAPINIEKLPMLFTVLPVMKGIPNSLYREKITVIAKPVLKNLGVLTISMNNEFPVEVKIDDTIEKGPWNKIFLTPGLHTVSISSENYETVSKQVGIENGRIADISIELVKKVPKVSFEVPQTAVVFLDGKKILEPGKSIEITEGDHVVVVSIGDYSLTQALSIEAGRTYHIQLLMDIVVKVD